MIYFSADHHFGHVNKFGGIIKFCNRPFRDVDHMEEELVTRWNSRVRSSEDIIYYLGDFKWKTSQFNTHYYREMLNGQIVFIKGNHDKQNGTNTVLDYAVITMMGRKILLIHNSDYAIASNIYYDMVLCGHSHNKWKIKQVNGKYFINIGVDVWDYEPVDMHQIIRYIKRYERGLECS